MIETGEIVKTVASGNTEEVTGKSLSQGFESSDSTPRSVPPAKPPPKLPEKKSGTSSTLPAPDASALQTQNDPNTANGGISPRHHHDHHEHHEHHHSSRPRSSSGSGRRRSASSGSALQTQTPVNSLTPVSVAVIPMTSGNKAC